MFTVSTQALPSRGFFYTEGELHLTPFGITEMMLVSEAIETNDDTAFVQAIQQSTNISSPLTMGDFYVIAAIQRILTFKKSPIEWEWTCSGEVLEFHIDTDEDKAAVLRQFILDSNAKEVEKGFEMYGAQAIQSILKDLQANYRGQFSGSINYCSHNNSTQITPELLLASIIQLPSDFNPATDLDKGYVVPSSVLIPEYKKLAKDDRMRKLLPLVCWLDDSQGKTLIDKIDTLQRIPNGMDILDTASVYDVKYQHGLKRNILCPPCERCGAQTDSQHFPITAHSFYRR